MTQQQAKPIKKKAAPRKKKVEPKQIIIAIDENGGVQVDTGQTSPIEFLGLLEAAKILVNNNNQGKGE